MPVPKYEDCMLPYLQVIADGNEYRTKEIISMVADKLNVSEDDRQELLSSGIPLIYNRVGWATTYLKKSGLITSPRRGIQVITNAGKQLLKNPPAKITQSYLLRFESFNDWISEMKGSPKESAGDINDEEELTPDEQIQKANKQLRDTLKDELLEKVLQSSPLFFEHLVIDLLLAMGYGGSYSEAAEHVGKSRDGGIDGVIKQDRLGLDQVVIQAKRWQSNVSRPEVQAFVGSMSSFKAKKGVFITTSAFSADAHEYTRQIEHKVVLIDGKALASYMIDYGIGVSVKERIEIKEVNSDYFPDVE